MVQPDPTMERLQEQIDWYDHRSMHNQRMFKWLKIAVMIAAASIPFCAGMGMSAYLTGGLGVAIVILEGLQQLNQYQHNWITYRSTCETLKHEKFLYLAKAGPYLNTADAHAILADRIESLISQEHAKWVSVQEQSIKKPSGG